MPLLEWISTHFGVIGKKTEGNSCFGLGFRDFLRLAGAGRQDYSLRFRSDRKSLSAHRDVRPEFEAGSGNFHSWMLADRGLRVKFPPFRDVGRAPHHVMTGPAG